MVKKYAVNPSRPPHPGQVLKTDYLEPMGLTVTELAAKLGVSRNTMSSIVNERAGVSADMALRFSKAFKTSPELWLKLEYFFQLFQARQQDSGWKEVLPVKADKRFIPPNGQGKPSPPKKKRIPRG
ncbi:MAG: HigA family addiction module antidote protein [Deltaproteobacteria bacterium]|jgi:addiction module HigA family antidote|nr:HigA family addiction module antidote protein [Deltaproteobacteria bacterium]